MSNLAQRLMEAPPEEYQGSIQLVRSDRLTPEQVKNAMEVFEANLVDELAGGLIMAALNGVLVVGVIAGNCLFSEEELYISIAVHPDYRRMGVGRKLLDAIKQQCTSWGVKMLHGECINDASRALFAQAGFTMKGSYAEWRVPVTEALLPGGYVLHPMVGDRFKLWSGPWHTVTSLGSHGTRWENCISSGWRGLPRFDPILPHGTGSMKHTQDEIAQAVDPSLLDQVIRDGVTYQVNWNGHDVVIEEPITESEEPEWKWVDDPERSACHVCRYKGINLMVYKTKYGKGFRWGRFDGDWRYPAQFTDTGMEISQTLARQAAIKAVDHERGEHAPDLPESMNEARALNSLKLSAGTLVRCRNESDPIKVKSTFSDGADLCIDAVNAATGSQFTFYRGDIIAVQVHNEWHKCRSYIRHGQIWLRLSGVTNKWDEPEAPDLPEAGVPALVDQLIQEMAPDVWAAMLDSGVNWDDVKDKIPHTLDARTWAREWLDTIKEHPTVPTDEGAMIGWFANAIMAGYDGAPRPRMESRSLAARILG